MSESMLIGLVLDLSDYIRRHIPTPTAEQARDHAEIFRPVPLDLALKILSAKAQRVASLASGWGGETR